MNCLSLDLPLAPVPASRPRVSRWSTHYLPTYEAYRIEASRQLAQVARQEPLSGPLTARFGFHIPRPPSHYRTGKNAHLLKDSAPELPVSKRSGDADNMCKAIMDALVEAGLLQDDAWIIDLAASKRYAEHGRTVCQIEEARPFEPSPFHALELVEPVLSSL